MNGAGTVTLGLHPGLLVLPVVPAVPGLRHQQGDDVVLGEAEQGAVVAGRVGEDGLDSSPAVLFQARCHGAGPGQRAGLGWEGRSYRSVSVCSDYRQYKRLDRR